jgi:hypothetical protein
MVLTYVLHDPVMPDMYAAAGIEYEFFLSRMEIVDYACIMLGNPHLSLRSAKEGVMGLVEDFGGWVKGVVDAVRPAAPAPEAPKPAPAKTRSNTSVTRKPSRPEPAKKAPAAQKAPKAPEPNAAMQNMAKLAGQTQGTILTIKMDGDKPSLKQSFPALAKGKDAEADTTAVLAKFGMKPDEAEEKLRELVHHLNSGPRAGVALVLQVPKGDPKALGELAEVAGLDPRLAQLLFEVELKQEQEQEQEQTTTHTKHLYMRDAQERGAAAAMNLKTSMEVEEKKPAPKPKSPTQSVVIWSDKEGVHISRMPMDIQPAIKRLQETFPNRSTWKSQKAAGKQLIIGQQMDGARADAQALTPAHCSPEASELMEAKGKGVLQLDAAPSLTPAMAIGSALKDHRKVEAEAVARKEADARREREELQRSRERLKRAREDDYRGLRSPRPA